MLMFYKLSMLFRFTSGVKQVERVEQDLFEIQCTEGPVEALAGEFEDFYGVAGGIQVGTCFNTIVLFLNHIVLANELDGLVLKGLLGVGVEEEAVGGVREVIGDMVRAIADFSKDGI